MHAENIKKWNGYLYKNVKADKNKYVEEETEEARQINVAAIVEMILEVEESPFYFTFDGNDMLIVDSREAKNNKEKKGVSTSSFRGR